MNIQHLLHFLKVSAGYLGLAPRALTFPPPSGRRRLPASARYLPVRAAGPHSA